MTHLQKTLAARLATASRQEIASTAGVATKTLLDVLKGRYATDPRPSNDEKRCSRKQLRGYAEALTRLSLFLDLLPEDTMVEYGLSPDWPDVQAALSRIKGRNETPLASSDPVIEAIARRGHSIQIGILRWAPFFGEGEDINTSWAGRYSRRLISSVNPLWRQAPFKTLDTIEQAIQAVVARGDGCDMVFGIYDSCSKCRKRTPCATISITPEATRAREPQLRAPRRLSPTGRPASAGRRMATRLECRDGRFSSTRQKRSPCGSMSAAPKPASTERRSRFSRNVDLPVPVLPTR